jgi:hypothetical protein
VIANITHYQPMTYNGHYRRNQTAPEFLRKIVWFGGEGGDENDFPKAESPVLLSILV